MKKEIILLIIIILVLLISIGVVLFVKSYSKDNIVPKEKIERTPIVIIPTEKIPVSKDNLNKEGIIAYLKTINPTFDFKNCVFSEPSWESDSNYVHISESVGGFKTNSGFVIKVENGRVIRIADNTFDFDKTVTIPEFDEENAIEQAKKSAAVRNRDKITEQKYYKFYDADEEKFYIRVMTTFEDEVGCYYATNYDYEIK